MALTILNTPLPEVALVKNPVQYTFQTDNYVVTAGVKSVFSLDFGGVATVPAGKTVHLTNTAGLDQLLTAGTVFTDGLTFPAWTAGPLATYLAALLSTWNENYYITAMYSLSIVATAIVFTAINSGVKYNLTCVSTITGIATTTTTAGVDEVDQFNMKCLVDVMVWNGSAWVQVIEMEQPFVKNGANYQSDFRVDDVLRANLTVDLPTNFAAIYTCANIFKQYYLRYAEKFGATANAPALVKITVSTYPNISNWCLLAGFANKDWPANTFNSAWTAIPYKFLTQQPRSKVVQKNQTEFLFLYVKIPHTAVLMVFHFYYTDGTNAIVNSAITDLALHTITALPSGPSFAIPISDLGRTVHHYTFSLYGNYSGGPGTFSETFTYYIEQRTFNFNHFLLYQNSLGGLDTVWLRGETTYSVDFNKVSGQAIINRDYNSYDAEFVENQKTFQEVYIFSTGPWPQAYIDLLGKEIANSEFVYLMASGASSPSGLQRLATPDIKKLDIRRDDAGLYTLKLSLKAAFLNKAVS